MVAMAYNQFGEYIGVQSPYAQPNTSPPNPPPPAGANVATLPAGFTIPSPGGTTIRDKVDYVWDFRHAFAWDQEPQDPSRALKVQNYRIIKAILIPYTYNRIIESSQGGVLRTDGVPGTTPIPPRTYVSLVVSAHLLIGYTDPAPNPPREHVPVLPPTPTTTNYHALGEFIRDQTPRAFNLLLLADETDRNTLETGVSWLSQLSARIAAQGGPRLKSTSDNEMDLVQEQQCFNWDFEADAPPSGTVPFGQVFGSGANPAPPNPQYPPPPPSGLPWLRNWQVSKAIRALYQGDAFIDPQDESLGTQSVQGEILIGFTGGGGM
jgi:hypothetical protein